MTPDRTSLNSFRLTPTTQRFDLIANNAKSSALWSNTGGGTGVTAK